MFTGPRLHIIIFSVVWCDTMYAKYKSRHDKKFFGVSDNVSPTQIGLFSQRRYIEALNVGCRNKRDSITCVAKTKALISYAVTTLLICVFVFTHAKKQVLS